MKAGKCVSLAHQIPDILLALLIFYVDFFRPAPHTFRYFVLSSC
jgi:hypothetical protein